MELKHCYYCKRDLPLEKFSKNKSKKDGLASECKECNSIIGKQRRLDHPDIVKQQKKADYEKHKGEYTQRIKEWQSTHQEEVKAYKKKNFELHKEEYRLSQNLRYHTPEGKLKSQIRIKRYTQTEKGKMMGVLKRARRKNNASLLPSDFTKEQWISCLEYFDHKCVYCGKELPLTQDHFVSLNSGGEFTKNNVLCACRPCNSAKCDRDFFEWYPKYKSFSIKRENKIMKYLHYSNKVQQLSIL